MKSRIFPKFFKTLHPRAHRGGRKQAFGHGNFASDLFHQDRTERGGKVDGGQREREGGGKENEEERVGGTKFIWPN